MKPLEPVSGGQESPASDPSVDDSGRISEAREASRHVRIVCRCGVVISQCRCPATNKRTIVSVTPCTHVCRHGKPPATQADMLAYNQRPDCLAKGECHCDECSTVCWDIGCELVL